MTIKAIETTWRGYRFRSRTEARWAVFFTHASIPFEYEPQGFSLPSGPYLPDFWLPSLDMWLEVKGQEPTEREVSLAKELAAASGKWVFLAVGAPDGDGWNYQTTYSPEGDCGESQIPGPASAFAAARGERFDGKPQPGRGPNLARGY